MAMNMGNTEAVTVGTATGTVVTMGIIYQGYKLYRNYKRNYTDKEKKQIKKLQDTYIDKCFESEKKYLSVSTLEDDKAEYPPFFQMDKKFEKPLKYKEFSVNPNLDSWSKHIGQSEFQQIIKDMLGYLCQFQTDLETPPEHKYSPIQLFSEEMKLWLLKLSMAKIDDENVKIIVDARHDYLQALETSNIFPKHYNWLGNKVLEPTPNQTMIKIMEKLETISKMISLAISRRSAREHFNALKVNIKSILCESIKFMFYAFSNDQLPVNFILSEIIHPTFPCYKKIQGKLNIQLLNQFVTLNHFSSVVNIEKPYTSVGARQALAEFDSANSEYDIYQFLTPTITASKKQQAKLNNANWYKSEKDNLKSGICSLLYNPEFKPNTTNTFETIIKQHVALPGLLYDLCLFYAICDTLYKLAGEGGNLLVYGQAAMHVEAAIIEFDLLLKNIEQTLKQLNDHITECGRYKEMNPNNKIIKDNNELEQWTLNFGTASQVCNENAELIQSIGECNKVSSFIKIKIKEINSLEYAKTLYAELHHLDSLTTLFCRSRQAQKQVTQAQQSETDISANSLPQTNSKTCVKALPPIPPRENTSSSISNKRSSFPESTIATTSSYPTTATHHSSSSQKGVAHHRGSLFRRSMPISINNGIKKGAQATAKLARNSFGKSSSPNKPLPKILSQSLRNCHSSTGLFESKTIADQKALPSDEIVTINEIKNVIQETQEIIHQGFEKLKK